MSAPRTPAGATLVELMVALTLALATMAALTALLITIVTARARAVEVAEAMMAVASTIDQIARDVRLAGYDPAAHGILGLSGASATGIILGADLDGDGTVDTASEEQIAYRLASAGDTLERVVGQQTLPLLSDVAPAGFRLGYVDADGAELDPSAPGTSAATRAMTIDLALRATAAHGPVRMRGGARLLNR